MFATSVFSLSGGCIIKVYPHCTCQNLCKQHQKLGLFHICAKGL